MANIIQQLEDLKEWGHDPTRYEQRLAFRSTFPYGEYGEVIDVDFDELSTREDEYYRKGPWKTSREDYQKGQLVQPGPGRPGYKGEALIEQPFAATKINLSEYEKKLIKDEFPEFEFKFNKKQPIGLKAYKNNTNYKRVVDFIKRDFQTTVAFEPLSLGAQREVMREFDLPKDMKWNFKKYRYGISDGRAKGEGKYGGPQRIHEGTVHKGDRKLVRRIAKFLSEPETSKTRYWGKKDSAGGSMINSVDRAVLQGNENYKLKIKDGRVIGFTDKADGITYMYKGHGEKRLKEGQKLITSHPHFKKYEKFYDIAKDATKSLDNTSRVFQKLFEGKGFDTSKIRFTDLVRFLGDETSKWQVENAVVKHHKKGVRTSPLLAKDLQIVTQVNNQYAEDMAKKIRNKKITVDELADIKKRGVRFQVDGKWYGGETGTTAEAQYKKIVQRATKSVSDWGPKEFNKFRKFTKQNPKLAKQASMALYSGIPIDEIMKMPGMKKAMPWIKGEGYFALADMLNNWSKGQSFLKGAGKGIEMATFGLVDFDTDEKALRMHALKKGVPENQIKAMMDYLKYKKEEKKLTGLDTSLAALDYHESIGGELGPAHMMNPEEGWNYGDREMLDKKIAQSEKNLDKLFNEYYAGDNRSATIGMVTLENMMESLTAEEWNKTAGKGPLDRGVREMIGIKADEGVPWGFFGLGMRKGFEKLGWDEKTDSFKEYIPQELMSAHPVHGYKEQIKRMEEGGEDIFGVKRAPSSPMEDIRTSLGYALPPQNYAGGGIANVRRRNAIPPVSGPMPQGGGLSTMFNRVKPW